MATNVHVIRGDKENNMSAMRRFRQKINEWGGLKKVRSLRYHGRALSEYVTKKNRLRALKRKEERTRLFKLGLIERE